MSLLPFLGQCIGRRNLVRYVLLPGCLGLALSHVGATPPADPHRAEVFTAASFEVTTHAATGRPSGFELQVYRLDGIQQLERALWVDLPGDPESVQRIALARLQQVDPPATTELQQAAVALTRAVEYGIDRYPAIVFDGTAVVYGGDRYGRGPALLSPLASSGGVMRPRSLAAAVLAVALLFSATGFAGVITTPQIITQTTAAALTCMQWMPTGICFWLRCSLSGCSVRTSVKVGHYNPDLVVSSYNELGGNPWLEIRATLGLALF